MNPRISLAIALSLALLFLGPLSTRTIAADPKPMTPDEIKAVVQKAARVCADTKPPTTSPAEVGDYLAVIKPLLDQGRPALPVLKGLATSKELTPVERRFAQILADRIENPAHFTEVAVHLTPVPETGIDAFSRFPRGQRPLAMRAIGPNLAHPEVRQVWVDYQSQRQAVDAKYDRLFTQTKPEDRPEVAQTLKAERHEERGQVRRATKSWRAIPDRSGYPEVPRLDPQYLLAWEEAMLRPLPWPMRHWYTHYVFLINDPASLPALGAVLRQAAVTEPEVENFSHNPLRFESLVRDITIYFLLKGSKDAGEGLMLGMTSFVNPEAVRVLSDVIAGAKDYKGPRPVAQYIGVALAKSKAWREYLAKPETGDDLKDARDRLRQALREGDRLIEQTRKEVEKDNPPSTGKP